MTELRVALPPIGDDKISADLRYLNEAIALIDSELAGEPIDYGLDHETSVFAMRRYDWGFCNCGTSCAPDCPAERPNFLYKPTGATVSWYKRVGRGMETAGNLPADFLTHCLKSLREQS